MGGLTGKPARPFPAFTPPVPIRPDHDLRTFRSGKAALDDWLRERALKNEGPAGRTYVVCAEGAVVAYYCLATGGTRHAEAPGRLRRNMPDPVPMLVLARLAVDAAFQRKGLGSGLLKDAMLRAAEAHRIVGFRALVVHAKDDEALGFYARYGFQEYPSGTKALFLPIETLLKGL